MLSFLKIESLAIIDSLSVEFGAGLNALTGETGAGKSIIVDAVSLLLGARGDSTMLRTGSDRLSIEGVFELEPRSGIAALLETMGIEAGADGLILRREVTAQGRSRAFINGTLATLQQLREIGESLADIHGQHEHQSLLRPEGQRDALDHFGGLAEAVEAVRGAASVLKGLLSERTRLRCM